MQYTKLIMSLILMYVCGSLQAQIRNIEKWGCVIIETQTQIIHADIEWLEKKITHGMPWIDDEIKKIESQFSKQMEVFRFKSASNPKQCSFEVKFITPVRYSFNKEEVEKVSNVLFSASDAVGELRDTIALLMLNGGFGFSYDSYQDAKEVRNKVYKAFFESMNVKLRCVPRMYTHIEQMNKLDRVMALLKHQNVKINQFNEKQMRLFLKLHLERFPFSYCQMLTRKIQKEYQGTLNEDRYENLPCSGCSFLLSNVHAIEAQMKISKDKGLSLFAQWLTEWLDDIAIILFDFSAGN